MSAAWEATEGLDSTWMAEATCARYTALPWTDDLRRVPEVLVDIMADICDQCPGRRECAAYAVDAGITAGWWAGVNLNGLQDWEPPTVDYFWDDVA